jgi:hypothetical protein
MFYAGLFVSLKVITPADERAYLIMFLAFATLGVKVVLGDLISGKFEYQKHGLCIMTLAAAVSSLSYLVPNTGSSFPSAVQRSFGYLIGVSLLATVVTASVSRALRATPPPSGLNILCFLNYALGSGVLGAYLYLIVTK